MTDVRDHRAATELPRICGNSVAADSRRILEEAPITKRLLRLCAPMLTLTTVLALTGCATLLPSSHIEVVSEWKSYDAAVNSLAKITPYETTRQDVHHEGLDPVQNPAVSVLHFADILQRFSAAALVTPRDVDRGIRDCLQAGRSCNGYAVSVHKLERNRVGNFWLDSLDFRRETNTQGWRVDALLIFVDDLLVYELVGGQPRINEVEVRRNPLGPLQGWGEQALGLIR